MQGTLSHLKRWDTATLAWVVWDGSLTTGSLVIGAVTQSGTWTVQPGNTANTTAWKVDGSAVTQPVSAASLPLPSGAATQTTLASLLTELQVKADPTESQQTKEIRAATSAVTSVADSASSVTLLAANANRLGAVIFNDSSAVLFLKLGATASSTSYTVRLTQYTGYEVPFGYTGVIDGIWASDPNDGAARIVELTA